MARSAQRDGQLTNDGGCPPGQGLVVSFARDEARRAVTTIAVHPPSARLSRSAAIYPNIMEGIPIVP